MYNFVPGQAKVKLLPIADTLFVIDAWDISRSTRFYYIPSHVLRRAHGIIAIYDITKSYTFTQLRYWIRKARNQADSALYIIVGNKTDLYSKREVNFEERKRLADEFHALFVETSVKTGEGVVDTFVVLAVCIHEKLQKAKFGKS